MQEQSRRKNDMMKTKHTTPDPRTTTLIYATPISLISYVRLNLKLDPHPPIQRLDLEPCEKRLVVRAVLPQVLDSALVSLGREGRVVRAYLVDLAPALAAGATEGELHV